jgi:hypothetical protein
MTDEAIIAEMRPLMEALCEDRLAPDEAARLEQLVLTSTTARWYYIRYVDLHGSLYWNTAGAGSADALSADAIPVSTVGVQDAPVAMPAPVPASRVHTRGAASRRAATVVVAACACVVIVLGWSRWSVSPTPDKLVEVTHPDPGIESPEVVPAVPAPGPRKLGPPVELIANSPSPERLPAADAGPPSTPVIPAPPPSRHKVLDTREVVAAINSRIREGWDVAAVRPSAIADDAEWLRRVSLDLSGRIPTVDEVETFLSNKRPGKRSELVDRLLDDTEFARNLTTVWTNLLIGRRSASHVNRPALQKFLRMSFAANRPWNQIVYDLLAAEGNNVENGATNFLIAHLNNDALPATAVTARVFLGEQLHCNQCHNNPFNKSQQTAFWELHSFFSQTKSVPRQAIDSKTGQPRYSYTELVTNTAGGPIFYETQHGVMRVAFPQFRGKTIDPSPETNRRAMLARLMTEGDQPQLAAAFVNRFWDHFFGRGFTQSVDDMGPHAAVSHPELLDLLTRQFIRSGYDTKQLVRWICASEPYQLTSRFGVDNRDDEPVEGQLPYFSRMYVKPMTPEQVYDSFVIATKAHLAGGVDWEEAESQRQQWLAQFVVDYETDENDEAMGLDGNLVQALTLMNGKLVEKALAVSPGTYLGEVVRRRTDEKDKIRDLCLSVLSRPPTPSELASMRKLIRQDGGRQDGVRQDGGQFASRGANRQAADAERYQDLMWALLNSSEFTSVH